MAAAIRNYTCPAVLNLLGPETRLKPRENEFLRELVAVPQLSLFLPNTMFGK
jgi:hypothetical protein